MLFREKLAYFTDAICLHTMNQIFISHPNSEYRLGDFLIESLKNPKWKEFRASVAFIKRSGTKHIHESLKEFIGRGRTVSITVGIDSRGTSIEGLQDLLNALQNLGDLFVFHNDNGSTFHPKIYLFKNDTESEIAIGSANLTEGGLFTNYEAWLDITLNLNEKYDLEFLETIENSLNEWSTPTEELCYKVTSEVIQQLISENRIFEEAILRTQQRAETVFVEKEKKKSLFARHKVQAAPRPTVPPPVLPPPSPDDQAIKDDADEAESLQVPAVQPVPPQQGKFSIFIMTLQKTDVGIGQTTKGTQRRSPEIFIPLICRDYDPDFWGWPDLFVEDALWTGSKDQNGHGKMDRANVMIRMGGETFPATIWYNPDKRDVRIRSEHIRSAGNIADILYLERGDGTAGFSYYAEIIPQGTVRYSEFIALCSKGVRNSKKEWNYI